MSDPTTVNVLLAVPTRGSDSGTWDTPVNNDFTSLDGHMAGVASVSLTNANVTLTKPTGTTAPGAGPTQSENAVIKFTGTLTGNPVVTFPLPGEYMIKNNCTVGSHFIQVRAAGTGNVIGLPPGRAVKVWNDGTDFDFCDAPEVGSYLDLAVSTTPAWMSACTLQPYLICDGASYSTASFAALNNVIGTTFGGSGSSFNVPDLQGRYRIPLDNTTSRITNAGCGITGNAIGSSGGAQSQTLAVGQLPSHNHALTDPGHTHSTSPLTAKVGTTTNDYTFGGASPLSIVGPATLSISSNTTGISIASTGSGQAFTTIPPGLVSGLTFIKS